MLEQPHTRRCAGRFAYRPKVIDASCSFKQNLMHCLIFSIYMQLHDNSMQEATFAMHKVKQDLWRV